MLCAYVKKVYQSKASITFHLIIYLFIYFKTCSVTVHIERIVSQRYKKIPFSVGMINKPTFAHESFGIPMRALVTSHLPGEHVSGEPEPIQAFINHRLVECCDSSVCYHSAVDDVRWPAIDSCKNYLVVFQGKQLFTQYNNYSMAIFEVEIFEDSLQIWFVQLTRTN